MLRVLVLFVSLTASACGTEFRPPSTEEPREATLAAIQNDIFATSCTFGSCHGDEAPAAELDLRAHDVCAALVGHSSCLFPNKMLVVPGKPELSFLLDKLEGRDLAGTPERECAESNEPMPFGAPPLAHDQIARVEAWIAAGARCERSGDPPDGSVDAGVGPPSALAGLTAGATTIRAGEQTRLEITLASEAPPGGQMIDLDVDDASVLGVPSAVHADAGTSTLEVTVIGKRPARPVRITVSTSTTSLSVSIGVTGLSLSEIHFDPTGTDDGYEWLELSNTTDAAIDLSAYSVGSGRTSYTYSIAQLAGSIPAHGCFVVGGPASGSGNPVYNQTLNFSPDLVNGSGSNGQAAGFALFDVPITKLTTSTLPFDAVLCGQGNSAALLDERGDIASPHCPDVAAGHSVSRLSSSSWVDQPSPTPNACSPQ